MAECLRTASTQLQLLVQIPVFDLQFVLSHLPPSYHLLCISNMFGFQSSFCSSATFSPSPSITSPSLILPPGFITPSVCYELNLNNVEAPYLIGCLIGQRIRALIKKQTKNNNSGCCCTKMRRKTTCVSVHKRAGAAHMNQLQNSLCLCWDAHTALSSAAF